MKRKVHKGLKKRVKVTKGGKVKRRKAGARHLKSKKSGNTKRQVRGTAITKGKTAAAARLAIS